ncbi:unnamed protein product [Ambrosiozyma monospora]|uniref:Unnamed protein product n=1 Tax=Ambrosiozyma monospora TaxID=43982 RepID=A0A9W6Z552_AMBMO|nr:unnamed protein product [Ambrosiozyma monospora]
MFNQVFRTKLARLINETFTDGEYLMSSDRSSSLSGTSGSIINFIKEWNSLVIPYLTTMYKANFLKLMKSIVKFISSSLESKIWSLDKNCNELGAAKLERDVSAIISEITKFDYSLRNEFIRVTQIIMMLGLDDDEEDDDLSDMEWALTPAERNRARNLRIDRK